ncbi:MAG: 23S rRNA (adenine(2503)-C(2))-methyltransferase RlmN [Pseudomonadota bacterium]
MGHDAAAAELPDLRSLDRAALTTLISELGEQPYRVGQVLRWLHRQDIASLAQMTNLPASMRQGLATRTSLRSLVLEEVQASRDGTTKLRWRLHDGEQIESVFIPDAAKEGRHALCISTQVGCAMGCAFCATASLGLKRQLSAAEIVEQVRSARRWLSEQPGAEAADPDADPANPRSGDAAPEKPRIGSIVLMGMGEPLHNYENTIRALRLLTDPDAHGYSPRRVTVSTVGLVRPLQRLLSDVDVQIAVSLVAARDAVRSEIMPVNRKHDVKALLEACAALPVKNRRRITFEVVLLAGVNDSDADALALARAVAPLRCKVNLIPYNPHPHAPFTRPSDARVLAFQQILKERGVGAYLRQPRGQDIDAACGMLVARRD